jgi:hypothetical protein
VPLHAGLQKWGHVLFGQKVRVPIQRPFVAIDRERDHDAIALGELADAAPDLDHLTHHFVTDHVAGLHRRNEVVEKMQVRAADRTARHPDDGIAVILDLGVGDGVVSDVLLAVPHQCLHHFLQHRFGKETSVRSVS